jgi:hypothetical protein
VGCNSNLEQQRQQGEPERSNTHNLGQLPGAECARTSVELGSPPANGTKVGLVRRAGPSRVVVGGPLLRVSKRLVGFVDGLEAGFRLRARVVVWMV